MNLAAIGTSTVFSDFLRCRGQRETAGDSAEATTTASQAGQAAAGGDETISAGRVDLVARNYGQDDSQPSKYLTASLDNLRVTSLVERVKEGQVTSLLDLFGGVCGGQCPSRSEVEAAAGRESDRRIVETARDGLAAERERLARAAQARGEAAPASSGVAAAPDPALDISFLPGQGAEAAMASPAVASVDAAAVAPVASGGSGGGGQVSVDVTV